MATSLSWKIGGVAVGLIVAGLAWNGLSRYQATRQANEIIQESARAAALEAAQAKAQAQQRHLELAANLQHRQEELANNYQQMTDQARQYQAAELVRQGRLRQEALQVEASYLLDRTQQCAGGIVINHQGSSFTKAVGKNGQPISCQGNKAAEPLR